MGRLGTCSTPYPKMDPSEVNMNKGRLGFGEARDHNQGLARQEGQGERVKIIVGHILGVGQVREKGI